MSRWPAALRLLRQLLWAWRQWRVTCICEHIKHVTSWARGILQANDISTDAAAAAAAAVSIVLNIAILTTTRPRPKRKLAESGLWSIANALSFWATATAVWLTDPPREEVKSRYISFYFAYCMSHMRHAGTCVRSHDSSRLGFDWQPKTVVIQLDDGNRRYCFGLHCGDPLLCQERSRYSLQPFRIQSKIVKSLHDNFGGKRKGVRFQFHCCILRRS